MNVRAKFYVAEKTLRSANQSIAKSDVAAVIVLQPVSSGSAENESFYRWTPGGRIELAVVKEETANQFELGAEYYIDFTKAE